MWPAPMGAGVAAPAPASAVAALEDTVEYIYTQVSPSVINIRVVQKQEVMFPIFPEIPGVPFFRMIPRGPQKRIRPGLGSGCVWDTAGHIVTNHHVVAGADRVNVTFADDTTVPATVVGTDPHGDLAVVKVDLSAKRLQPVHMADSTYVKVGQLAVAIGNPFGLQSTMTVGFVSALRWVLRADSGDEEQPGYTIPDIIQTDAPINPGNSGGVLADDEGHVIGVTSAIISPVRASVGIGFAILSAIVQKVMPTLIKTGHYDHPWLGVSGISLSPGLAKAMQLDPRSAWSLGGGRCA